MVAFSTLAVAGLAAVASALPKNSKPQQPQCKGTPRNANFDDLTSLIPGNAFNTIPTPYMGLYYQGFDFANVVQTNLAPGVVPHSSPNYAVSNVVSQLDGTPMLTTFYQGSNVKSFDLQSFYFGCVINLAQGAAAVPNACNIQVTGYQGSDNSVSNAKQVCSQQFQYNPSTALGVQQQAFSGPVKSCFKNLQFAIVTFNPPGGQSALAPTLALLLDDIKYTTYQCKA